MSKSSSVANIDGKGEYVRFMALPFYHKGKKVFTEEKECLVSRSAAGEAADTEVP